MAIPTIDFLEAPVKDEFMDYDFNESRYRALVDGITKNSYVNLVIDWQTKENAQSYLDLLSRVVMETILSFKDEKYKYTMLYYMSHSKKMRIELQKVFADSVWYNRRDGGFMMAYNSGANLNQGKLIEFGIDKAISSIARQMIKNSPLGTRYMTVDINEKQIFASLTTLLAYLTTTVIGTTTAGNFVIGEEYTILVVGTTDFTLIGASANTIGVVFVATGVGVGTGTATTTYITTAESAVVADSEDLNDLPYTEDYQLVTLENDRYLFTNIKSIKSYIEDRWIYDNATGSW